MAPIQIGDKLPSAEVYEDSPENKFNIAELKSGKKVAIFGVSVAFTSRVSSIHLSSFVSEADRLESEQGIEAIICVSVNDPFVFFARGMEHNACDQIRMIADSDGNFSKALDLTIKLPVLVVSSKRFSMMVDNGLVTELNVEPDGLSLTCSLGGKIGKN